MPDFFDVFDSREKGLLIWLLVFVLGALRIRGVRQSVPGLVKTLVSPVLLVPFSCAAAYVAGVVVLLAWLDLWTASLLDVTLFWFFGAGVAAFAASGLKAGDPALFRRSLLRKSLTWVLLVEFIANVYVFSLPAELVLIPCVTFVVLLDAVAETKREFAPVKKLTDWTLGAFGIFLLARAVAIIASDPGSFTTSQNVMGFVLPLLLSIPFLPFAYVLAVWTLYNSAFARLNVLAKDRRLARFATRAILGAFRLDRRRLAAFAGPGVVQAAQARDKREIREVIRSHV